MQTEPYLNKPEGRKWGRGNAELSGMEELRCPIGVPTAVCMHVFMYMRTYVCVYVRMYTSFVVWQRHICPRSWSYIHTSPQIHANFCFLLHNYSRTHLFFGTRYMQPACFWSFKTCVLKKSFVYMKFGTRRSHGLPCTQWRISV